MREFNEIDNNQMQERIMIVDDDPYNLMALKILLTKVDSMFIREISENTEIKSNLIKIIDAKSGG